MRRRCPNKIRDSPCHRSIAHSAVSISCQACASIMRRCLARISSTAARTSPGATGRQLSIGSPAVSVLVTVIRYCTGMMSPLSPAVAVVTAAAAAVAEAGAVAARGAPAGPLGAGVGPARGRGVALPVPVSVGHVHPVDQELLADTNNYPRLAGAVTLGDGHRLVVFFCDLQHVGRPVGDPLAVLGAPVGDLAGLGGLGGHWVLLCPCAVHVTRTLSGTQGQTHHPNG